jgi:hypothetical protein
MSSTIEHERKYAIEFLTSRDVGTGEWYACLTYSYKRNPYSKTNLTSPYHPDKHEALRTLRDQLKSGIAVDKFLPEEIRELQVLIDHELAFPKDDLWCSYKILTGGNPPVSYKWGRSAVGSSIYLQDFSMTSETQDLLSLIPTF